MRVQEQDFEACSDVLEQAFVHDPLFHYLFDGRSNGRIKKFFRFALAYTNVREQLVIGQKSGEVIQGVACIERPSSPTNISMQVKVLRLFLAFAFQMKWSAFLKINHYMKTTSKRRPKEAHYYLGCIGVNPNEQGKGIGRNLLEVIHRMVDEDSTAAGIGLDTENLRNVSLYEKFGYEVVGEDKLGDITIYSMFRKKMR
ncbi:GNAT family N-acetyltransferase [Priestia taiwanensis]|uniref:N-acetyltransferase GCN5 n=1 Tax=Priestia taiwanensis TaxID=1347902 RepID=A0A917AQN8_9BACI|nr:GNAT family N-acetyltransferase [Priestia taiwanensis]MBM7363203.1 ribosomal protein S18 acetylase RimI-like enzyme [Priestia taiwanensis]GGE68502.1 N-acetyltransferase GCN5 [Priestia taiwanensis]